jgi:hypothetical protein
MIQAPGFSLKMCPQAAPMLDVCTMRLGSPGRASQCVDFKLFWLACFVIDLSQAAPGAALQGAPVVFFTKLSTESVHGSL